MLGVATLLETAGVLNTFTRSLACLAHCHPSVFPVLLAGLLGGVFVGIYLSVPLDLLDFYQPPPSPSSITSSFPKQSPTT